MLDKIKVSRVDAIANFAKLWAECLAMAKRNPDWTFHATLSDGTKICGQVHESLRAQENHGLVGKCLDLESAYRQLPVRPAHAHLAIFALKNPTTEEV